jgi:hypothetical protein
MPEYALVKTGSLLLKKKVVEDSVEKSESSVKLNDYRDFMQKFRVVIYLSIR